MITQINLFIPVMHKLKMFNCSYVWKNKKSYSVKSQNPTNDQILKTQKNISKNYKFVVLFCG